MELSGRKARVLQQWSSLQLDDRAGFVVMDIAEEFAFRSEGPMNKMMGTPMFPLGLAVMSD